MRARRSLRSLLSSYRLRLLAWFVGLLALGTVATVLVVGEVVLQGTDERVRSELIQESEEFASLIGGTDPETGQPFGADVQRIFDVFLDRNVAARNEVVLTFVDGAFHRRSRPAPPIELQLEPGFAGQVATASQPANGRYVSSVGAVDYLAVPVNVDGVSRGVFVVAAFRDLERAEQDDILRAVTTVGLVLLVIGSILAWRLADRVLAPVRRTTATARSISETDLDQRVVVEGHDEVAELAQTLNEMLDRVSTAIDEQRRFMDDAGHELRTPLTIARGHLELVAEDDPEEVRRTVDLVVDEVDRMTRIVNDLVVLAAATRPDFVRRTTFSSAQLLRSIFDKARVLAPREWRLEVSGDVNLSADRQRLTQAVLQLAQNAVQHTTEGDVIELGADVAADRVWLWVRDSGRGIPADQQEAIFRRFVRLEDGARSSGGRTGLGLAIVSAIADAHGGTVSVESELGAGARFTLSIPVQTREARRQT
jgi:signal transduction histidine kinase